MVLSESPIIVYSTVIAAAFATGYYAGSTSKRLGKESTAKTRLPEREVGNNESDSESESSSVDGDGDIASLSIDPSDDCKMVLVVRTDLGMSGGKIAAQCSHATLACYKTLLSANPAFLRQWERSGQTKVALKVSSEDELLLLQAQAQSLGLCARSIQDAGRTQIAAGSRTVLGIAGPARLVNRITGSLRLL